MLPRPLVWGGLCNAYVHCASFPLCIWFFPWYPVLILCWTESCHLLMHDFLLADLCFSRSPFLIVLWCSFELFMHCLVNFSVPQDITCREIGAITCLTRFSGSWACLHTDSNLQWPWVEDSPDRTRDIHKINPFIGHNVVVCKIIHHPNMHSPPTRHTFSTTGCCWFYFTSHSQTGLEAQSNEGEKVVQVGLIGVSTSIRAG